MDYWFGDGFDWLPDGASMLLRWSFLNSNGAAGPTTDTAFGTGRSFAFSGFGASFGKRGLRKEPIINGSIRVKTVPGWRVAHRLTNGAGTQVTLSIGSDSIQVWTGDAEAGGTLIGEQPNPFGPNLHTSIQYRVLCDNQNGEVHIWKNGSQNYVMPAIMGANTRGGSLEGSFDGLSFASNYCVIDDVLLCSPGSSGPSAKIGDIRVFTQRPNAAGASTQFVPSNVTRPNWEMVAGNPDGDATFVESDVVGALDLYRVTPLPSTPSRVYFAMPWGLVRKTDAGPLRAAIVHQSGGVQQSVVTNDALGGSFELMEAVLPTDPATTATWNRAGLEAQQIGFKKEA